MSRKCYNVNLTCTCSKRYNVITQWVPDFELMLGPDLGCVLWVPGIALPQWASFEWFIMPQTAVTFKRDNQASLLRKLPKVI